ncbi:acyl transferase domain-containing protein [Streptomyces sp. Ag109_G2-6]|uniref:type I polyketide synthase n=1 Tax=Streptomyces sp. Ag109_G2-6 TaxID=2485154 RepID=UPI000F4F934C|nr:type I polyketide synthase [Streptomyces sp. Ag109_G2-6]RPF40441.1 acyl transferase domain-containing protein [Streptomyces sp. Ag109_G2-6]
MSSPSTPDPAAAAGSTLTRALAAVRDLRRKVDSLENAKREGIAIIGMGCRFPGGANSPDALWRLLESGTDAITEVPPTRWDQAAYYDPDPDAPGRMYARHGGFIDGVDRFDPYFFGISPREAAQMDPQQRIFLEVAWEAWEDAGLTREAVQGSNTGVFVGANSSDYLQMQFQRPQGIDTYTSAGGANSLIPNRLSYLFDLRGPSLVVDTACSSSLVALHLAAQSLRGQECETAVVGGLNLVLSPMPMVGFAKIGALAPDGRCKTFDSRADGYVRGEGVGVVVLKRLSDALAAGDRIWAVVRGSAVNQDGLTNGLTAPNGVSQREVISSALRAARLEPSQVTLLEAHGTGTALGDPIEVEALNEVYGRPGARGSGEGAEGQDACALGSVKTNIGHLEAGSGIAGLLKAALSIHHRAIAPNLHLEALNPHISLDGSRLFVPTEPQPWKVSDDRRHAAVSAFGAGGTNAHVVLGPAPAAVAAGHDAEPGSGSPGGLRLLTITARTADALAPMAAAYREHLRSPAGQTVPFPALAHAAAVRRTQHPHRCVVVADSHAQAADRLTAWLDGNEFTGGVIGRTTRPLGRGTAFVFAGHGSQRLGMGRELMRDCAVFRSAAEECDETFRRLLGRSVIDEIHRTDTDTLTTDLEIIQPALFTVAVALAARWRSFGVEPDVVVGHSTGEIAAAHVAGALTLEDAARVIHVRSGLLGRLHGSGSLLVVGLPMDEADALLDGCRERVAVAVSNSPTSTVLSGDTETLETLATTLRERNVFCRSMKNTVAGHGPQVDRLREDLLEGLAGLAPKPSAVPIFSTVAGKLTDGSEFDAAYWYRNLREPVLFWQGMQDLVEQDNGVFVELSPHPLLLSAVEQALERSGREGLALPSMRRAEPEAQALLEGLGALHANGLAVPLDHLFDGPAPAVPLPAYAWQHESFWFRTPAEPGTEPGSARAAEPRPEPEPVPVSGPADRAPEPVTAPADVYRLVVGTVADVLGFHVSRIDPQTGFFQMGMDSLLATQVRKRLENALGLALTTAVMFEHPTVEGLSTHLTALVGPDLDETPAAEVPPTPYDTEAAPYAASADNAHDHDVEGLTEQELLAILADEIRAADRAAGSSE